MCHAGRHHSLAAALAALLGLLNPALCVIHCLVLHGGHGGGAAHAHHHHGAIADASNHSHAAAPDQVHHSHALVGTNAAPVASHCLMAHQPGAAGEPLPQALYELAPLAALLMVFMLLPLHAPRRAAAALRSLARWSPPIPPPRPFALS